MWSSASGIVEAWVERMGRVRWSNVAGSSLSTTSAIWRKWDMRLVYWDADDGDKQSIF